MLERMRQKLEEDRAQQGADGEAHQRRNPARTKREGTCSGEHRQHAAGETGGDYGAERGKRIAHAGAERTQAASLSVFLDVFVRRPPKEGIARTKCDAMPIVAP